MQYNEMSKEQLLHEKDMLEQKFKEVQDRNLKLDMSRGKPCVEQLDLSMGMMDVLSSTSDLTCEDGTDCHEISPWLESTCPVDRANRWTLYIARVTVC